LPVARRRVGVLEHPGLFVVTLAPPRGTSAAANRHEPRAMRPGRARVAPTDRYKGGLHRYCSGCTRETEHAAWAAGARGSTPSTRWPTTGPPIGTTICMNCGEWRAASPQPRPPAWSSWPRSPVATPSQAVTAYSSDSAGDQVYEISPDNEGMPPRGEPPRPRRSRARLRSSSSAVALTSRARGAA
jgi:hypothetical protein